MNGLVDTHALLWFVGDDPKLSPKARQFLTDANNILYISAATLWELAIKVSVGKLSLGDSYDAFAGQAINDNRCR
jgi:PIN domain nuclease of toxin-antitoxin system